MHHHDDEATATHTFAAREFYFKRKSHWVGTPSDLIPCSNDFNVREKFVVNGS